MKKTYIGRKKDASWSLGISSLTLASMFSELQYWDG